MARTRVFPLALAAILSLAGPAFAQRTTGGLVGTVTDGTGAVLPGVTVNLTGERVMGIETAVTNENGVYRFVGLSPGSYDISFAIAGFAGLKRTGIVVSLGATQEVNVALQLSNVAEEVTVSAAAGVVDTQSTEVGTNYDNEWIKNAPVPRNSFFDLLAAAPGVTTGTNAVASAAVYGSARDDNSYQLDGTDITDAFFGQAFAQPNADAIEEIEILSLGAPAEYGNIQGAVFNIVTKQGSNIWRGDANFYFQSDGLTGRNTIEENDKGFPFLRDKYRDFSAQIGGPIKKDKLWFFGSYQYQLDGTSPVGVDPVIGTTLDDRDRFLGKVNTQITPNHRLVGTYHHDLARDERTRRPNRAPSTYVASLNKSPTPGASYTGIFGSDTVVEVRYSGFYGTIDLGPAEEGVPRTATRFYDLDTGFISGGHYYWYALDVSKTTINGKVSHFADNFLGTSHDFKFGVQYGHATAGGIYGYNDFVFTYDVGGAIAGYGYARVPFSYGGNTRSIGIFADDTVQLGSRITADIGVRFDSSKAYIPSQPELDVSGRETGTTFPSLDLFTWKTVSPRLGINMKLTGDGKTVLKAHWGRYHRTITTGDFANIIGPSIPAIFVGTYNAQTGQLENLERFSDTSNLHIDPDLVSPHTDQFIVSLDRELVSNLGVSVIYVNKRGRNFSAWQDITGVYREVPYTDNVGRNPSGNTFNVFQLQTDPGEREFLMTSPPGMETDVNALSLVATKRMSNRWQLTSSLVLSRAEGRLSLSASDALTQRSGLQFNTFGRNPNDFVNTYGRLNGDRPVTFKTQLVYQFPADILGSINYLYSSGAPKVRTVRINSLARISPTQIVTAPRGELDGSFPDQSLLSFRLQKDFRVGGRARAGLFIDGFNVLNDDAHEGRLSRLATSSNYDVPDLFILPRRFMVGGKFTF
jgi:hypothetical protein